MPLPNMAIAKSFIESYLNIRKDSWKLDFCKNQEGLQNLSANTIYKLSVCQQALIAINNANSYKGWLAAVDLLHDLQQKEEKKQSERFFFVRAVTNEPLVGHMLHAIRSYIISELLTDEKFQETLLKNAEKHKALTIEIEEQKGLNNKDNMLEKQKLLQELEKTIQSTNCNDEYYSGFFNLKIKKLDKEAATLKENSFEDFKQHVLDNTRPLMLSDWLNHLSLDSRDNECLNNSAIKNNGELNQSSSPTQDISSSSHDKEKTVIKDVMEENNTRKFDLNHFSQRAIHSSRNHTKTKRFIDDYQNIYQQKNRNR